MPGSEMYSMLKYIFNAELKQTLKHIASVFVRLFHHQIHILLPFTPRTLSVRSCFAASSCLRTFISPY